MIDNYPPGVTDLELEPTDWDQELERELARADAQQEIENDDKANNTYENIPLPN